MAARQIPNLKDRVRFLALLPPKIDGAYIYDSRRRES